MANYVPKRLMGIPFADVNSRLCLKLDDEVHYYEDDEEFMGLIEDRIEEEEVENNGEDKVAE